ncbi:MAG TPA: sugar phosphate isomerase/epimerase [Clostridiaceae bacterium]|nr:sugar phosphate isomerase/epimerase [Clostridiaceae bacterium]
MKLGYMTNAFGKLVGDGGGVQNIKDVHYVTLCEMDDAIKKIAKEGYKYIEIFDGNLQQYENNVTELKNILSKYSVDILGVYLAGFFIYDDALEEELARIEKTVLLAKEFNIKHVVVGGGSVRLSGIKEGDAKKLGKALDKVAAVIEKHGLIPSYHPHLGSIAEKTKEIDEVFASSSINFCPDIAHLVAGGSDALSLIKKYLNRIKYVHLKDLSSEGEFVPLGKGIINLVEIIEYLQSNNYTGDYLVEIDGYSGDAVEACSTSYDFLKKHLMFDA